MKTFGIIGMGRIGKAHFEQCQMIEDFKVVSFCENNKDILPELENELGIKGYSSYDDYLDSTDADILILCTPSHLHCEQTIKALEKGFNVICEKPVSCNLEEARQMQAAVQEGKFLTVNQCKRFQADIAYIHDVVASGELGDIYHIYCGLGAFNERSDWQIYKKYNGGQLANWGVHMIDSLLYIMNSKPVSVNAKFYRILDKGDAEDSFKVSINLENGAFADAEFMKSFYPKAAWQVCGTKGSMVCDKIQAQTVIKKTVLDENGEKVESEELIDFTKAPNTFPQLGHFKALDDSFKNNKALPISLESVMTTMAVMDAARKSNETGLTATVESV